MSTLSDVAEAAGVSPMTVSRCINQPERLSPATRVKVEKAIDQLQYVPNAAARSLTQGRTETIALVLVDVTNPFFTTLSRGVEDEAAKAGYTLMLGNTDETIETERRYLNEFISRQVDGVILSPAPGAEHHLDLLRQRDIPVVLIDRQIRGADVDIIRGDSFEGGVLLTNHLVEVGYSDIAFVGGLSGTTSLQERLAGYRQALDENNLQERVYLGSYDRQSGENIVRRLLEQSEVPDAIVAANNFVAVGALTELRQHGLSVPDDVALACFDDVEIAAAISPFLTVASQPAYEMGCSAMEMLLDRIEGSEEPPRERVFPVEMIVRKSSGALD